MLALNVSFKVMPLLKSQYKCIKNATIECHGKHYIIVSYTGKNIFTNEPIRHQNQVLPIT